MPPFKQRDSPDPQAIAASALALFKRISPPPWPLARLALVATEFTDLGGAGSGAAMARFLTGHRNQRLQQAVASTPQQQQHTGQQQTEQVLQPTCEKVCLLQAACSCRQQQQHVGGDEQQQEHQPQGDQVGQLSVMPCDLSCGSPGSAQHTHTTDIAQQAMDACQQQQAQHQPDFAPVQHCRQGEHTYARGKHLQTAGPVVDSRPQDTLLSSVDIAEQAKLLRDIELQQLRQHSLHHQHGNSSSKKRKQATAQGTGLKRSKARTDKQQSIAQLFGKLSK